MFFPPGQAVTVEFRATAGVAAIALVDPSAIVVRDGADTTVATAIASPALGRYLVTFTVPSHWVYPQMVSVRLSGGYEGAIAELTKLLGQVGDPLTPVDWLARRQGLGTAATVKDALLGEPGYLQTTDGISQTLTVNTDGSVTIESDPD